MASHNVHMNNFANNGTGRAYDVSTSHGCHELVEDGFFKTIKRADRHMEITPRYPGVGLCEGNYPSRTGNVWKGTTSAMFFIASSPILEGTKVENNGRNVNIELIRRPLIEGEVQVETVLSFLLCNFKSKTTMFTAHLNGRNLFKMVVNGHTCQKMAADFDNHQIIISDTGVELNNKKGCSELPISSTGFKLSIVTSYDGKENVREMNLFALTAGVRFDAAKFRPNPHPRFFSTEVQRDGCLTMECDGLDSVDSVGRRDEQNQIYGESTVGVGAVSDVKVTGSKFKAVEFDSGEIFNIYLMFFHRESSVPMMHREPSVSMIHKESSVPIMLRKSSVSMMHKESSVPMRMSKDGKTLYCTHGAVVPPLNIGVVYNFLKNMPCKCVEEMLDMGKIQ